MRAETGRAAIESAFRGTGLFLLLVFGLLGGSLHDLRAQTPPPADSVIRNGFATEGAPSNGPTAVPNGTLMIVGGGVTESLHRRFARLAGGTEAKIVCVPTAVPHGTLSGWCRRFFREARVPKMNRTVLHTRRPKKADQKSFAEPLHSADAVWFTGGRQWRLVEAYAGTRTLEAFHGVLERGGVIGGTSAGASIQGSFLVRGDPKSKRIVVGKYTDGFGFLPGSAIDQHLRARNREEDLIDVIEERPELLGIGVDEGTAAIVQGDTLRVVGEGVVAIYDAHRWTRASEPLPDSEKYFFLRSGNRFDLRTRAVLVDQMKGNR